MTMKLWQESKIRECERLGHDWYIDASDIHLRSYRCRRCKCFGGEMWTDLNETPPKPLPFDSGEYV